MDLLEPRREGSAPPVGRGGVRGAWTRGDRPSLCASIGGGSEALLQDRDNAVTSELVHALCAGAPGVLESPCSTRLGIKTPLSLVGSVSGLPCTPVIEGCPGQGATAGVRRHALTLVVSAWSARTPERCPPANYSRVVPQVRGLSTCQDRTPRAGVGRWICPGAQSAPAGHALLEKVLGGTASDGISAVRTGRARSGSLSAARCGCASFPCVRSGPRRR